MDITFAPSWSGWLIPRPHRRLAPSESDGEGTDETLFDLGSESLRHTALFRDFAGADPTPEGVRKFLADHADLGTEPAAFFVPRSSGTVVAFPYDQRKLGDADAALREMLQLQRSVELWDMIQNRDLAGLARHITRSDRPDGPPSFLYSSHPRGSKAQPPDATSSALILDIDPDVAAETARKDLRPAARAYLMGVINQKLEGGLNVQVLESPGGIGKMELHLIPRTLVTALWLQFAEEVTGKFRPSQCLACDKWFRPTKHKDRLYCKGKCKTAACRLRANARQLNKEGKSTKQIARQLKISEKKVKRLLSSKKGEQHDGAKASGAR